MTIQEIQQQLQLAKNELQSLENQYVGHTPAQQQTLDLLKNADIRYKTKKDALIAKISYLEAELKNALLNKTIDDIKREDGFYEAMLDYI